MVPFHLNKISRALEHYGTWILGLTIAGVVLGGGFYALLLGDQLRFLPDESDYYTLAVNLISTRQYSLDGINPTAFRPPGYPLFLAGWVLFGAGIPAQRFANFIALALSLTLLFKLLQAQVSPLAAGLGVLMTLFYPVLFFTAGALYPQTIATTLFLLVLYLIIPEVVSPRRVLLGGLVLGLLILTVSSFWAVFPVLLVWLWFYRPKARVARLALFMLATSLFTLVFPGVSGYAFQKNWSEVWVLWSLDGNAHPITLPSPPSGVSDLYGDAEPFSGTSLTVGLKPLYVTWGP